MAFFGNGKITKDFYFYKASVELIILKFCVYKKRWHYE